jgi:uncharacterized protein YndB with AHSA1/START domain
MNEYGIDTEAGAVRFERLLPGPIERVWAYLTDPAKRATWLAAGPMELRVGGRVELNFHHADLSAEKTPPERYKNLEGGHTLLGQVTRCEPPRLLSYTWAEWGEVTFELTPRGKDVLLVLTHERPGEREAMVSVSGGWHAHLGILADNLDGREPRPFWSTHAKAATEYEKRIAAQ